MDCLWTDYLNYSLCEISRSAVRLIVNNSDLKMSPFDASVSKI